MKIILVLLTHIDNLPPARNLLLSLSKLDVEVEFITMYSSALPAEIKNSKNITVYDVQERIETNRLKCFLNRFIRRNKLHKLIKQLAGKNDVVWTVTDYEAMEVGKLLQKYRHIVQLMELIHDIPIFDELPYVKANIARYARTAEMVIVPEYNRAHIQQAYWQLKKTPVVLPNKPTIGDVANFEVVTDDTAQKVLEKIGNRKIILYQGVFGYERVLDQFIEAVDLLGEEYCMLLMGQNDMVVQQLLKKYPQVYFIPFISAPNHLTVTKRAYVGVLSYVNTSNIRHFDPLNALYCAPNKIYEYACFGIPMVGNSIPGLDGPFRRYGIGICAEELTSSSIANTIRRIEANYAEMSENCRTFYREIDMDKLVENIIQKLKDESNV